MLARVIESRTTARAAVIGLAVGLVTMAGLGLWTSTSMQRATAQAQALNDMSDRWSQVVHDVQMADNALRDYLRAGTGLMRQPVASAAGSADDTLLWLQQHGTPEDIEMARRVSGLYGDYTGLLREVVALGDRGDMAQAMLQASQAQLAVGTLNKQLGTVIQAKRLETSKFLRDADIQNRKLRLAAVAVFGVNLGLLALCSMVLIGYRRRILRQVAQNQHEALHDALTGLANRTLLAQRTEQAVREAQADGKPVALLLIDLNRFKQVNDTLGHLCGDLLLQQVAARLTRTVRQGDTVARLGGDEFAVLLPRVGSVTLASHVAERVQHALGEPAELDGLRLEVEGSVGVAVYPANSGNAAELLKHADIAMYAAKRGRIGVAVYEPRFDEHSRAQLTVQSELRDALDRGELVLHYQPKAAAQSGTICGVEALARWQHPRRGLLGPGEFIPVAEETGMIDPLTRYVMDAALAQWHDWTSAGRDMPISVNVGAQCLHNLSFPDRVGSLLSAHRTPPEVLTLEITESAIIADPSRAMGVLARLADMGVRLSIDDFGAGYSAISYLRNMRIHEMKLDRAFVTPLRSDTDNIAIVNALLDLAHSLQLRVVAEGVEDRATWIALAALGCDTVQGFYLSKPLPPAGLVDWLERWQGGPPTDGDPTVEPPLRAASPVPSAMLGSVSRHTALDTGVDCGPG